MSQQEDPRDPRARPVRPRELDQQEPGAGPVHGGAGRASRATVHTNEHPGQAVADETLVAPERPMAARGADVAAQHARWGGFKVGAAFFGWLSAMGLAALLTALLAAGGTALALNQLDDVEGAARDNASTIGIGGGIALVAILLLAYFAGGYVAGRLARFDGARQGLGVWILSLLAIVAFAVAGALFGSEYNVLSRLDLPRIPVDEGDVTTGGVIALIAAAIGTLVAAVLGGKMGERYHRRIDRTGAAVDGPRERAAW